MNKTLWTLTASTAALLTLGCQPRTKTKVVEVPKQDKVYDFTKESYGEPIPVPIHDAACNSQRGLGLSNGIIEEAYLGAETDYIHTITYEKTKGRDITRETFESQKIQAGRPVYLCRDASTIPVNSQEGAAISMKADADQAFALYEAVKQKGSVALPSLKRLHLNAVEKERSISRRVENKGEATERTRYTTDNAAYMNSALISYPQSKHGKEHKLLGGAPLWTVDGIFQHEFGHFIFDSVMNEDGIVFASYDDYVAQNPHVHLFHTTKASLALIAETPALKAGFMEFFRSQDFIIGSLNEGFADLWSYYTLKQPADLFNVSCFIKNRNVASPLFYNGISKNWDDYLWNKLSSAKIEFDSGDQSEDPIENCSQPSFTDIHIIGAAMAHTVDAVFTAAAQTHDSSIDTSLLKAEMSLAWLQSIKNSNEFVDLGGKASLSRILNTAVGTGISNLKSPDRTSFCTVVSSKFPVLVKRWKDAKTDNEDVSGVVSFCSL